MFVGAFLSKWVNVRPHEVKILLWAWLYVFVLFVAYYVLRPIRDELGVTGGVGDLPWLFTGTLIAMLILSPIYGYLVNHWDRERFIAIAYRFFMAHLLIFMMFMYGATGEILAWTGRLFFIWVSVFNLFVVSVFWSLMSDVFDTEQGKRLFGVLATGATLGGIIGSAFVAGFADVFSQYVLLFMAVVLLEVAVQSAKHISRLSTPHQADTPNNASPVVKDSIWSGLQRTFSSPYLLGISAFILLYSITSTVLYFQQAQIVGNHFESREARTAFFAQIDLWVNGLTLLFQLGLTGRMMKYLGIIPVLAILPLFSVISFALLALYPTVIVFVIVQVARRVSNFAFARPSREVLFTRLSREDRYKAKNVIDTVVYRTGDQLGSWGYAGLSAMSLSLSAISWVAVPVCMVWFVLAVWLAGQEKPT